MSSKKMFVIAVFLFLLNVFYSSYALKVSKEYTEKMITLKSLEEEVMVMTAELETKKMVAIKKAKTNISWDKIIFNK